MPEGLTRVSKRKILHAGSHGNEHSFNNGVFYPQKSSDNILGYFVAKNTTLLHPEHGFVVKSSTLLHPERGLVVKNKKLREAKIADGIYELRSQVEITHQGMREVID